MSGRGSLLARIALAAVAFSAADLGIGFLYRALTGESLYYDVVDPERGANRVYRARSPIYSHDLLPNVDALASWGKPYRIATNSLAFKDRGVRDVSLRAAHPRLLFIGDSFTEGVGLPYEASFVGLIDERLRGRGVEVLNAGVSSYSPAIYYRKVRYLLEERGLEIAQLIVLLDISDIQDEAEDYELDANDDVVFRRERAPGVRDFLREYSVLSAFFRALNLRLAAAREAERPAGNPLNASIDNPRGAWTVSEESYRRYGERGLAAARAHMDRLADLVRRHGIGLTLVVYPWPTQIAHADLDSLQVRFWRDWAAQQGARFVDLFPAFVSADEEANRRTIRDLFIRDDFHWNEQGHRRVADLLLAQLELPRATPRPSDRPASGAADPPAPRPDPGAADDAGAPPPPR